MIVAYVQRQPPTVLHALYGASLSTAGCLAATAMAAPIMWSLKATSQEEPVVKWKLDRFAYWHGWRAAFQMIAFAVLLWALVATI